MLTIKWIMVWISGIFFLGMASCATVPREPLDPGEVRLLGIYIPEGDALRPNLLSMMQIRFEAEGKPEITRACFNWSGGSLACFKITDVHYGSPGVIRVYYRTPSPGTYVLESHVLYIRDGKTYSTNKVKTHTRVLPP